MRTYLRDFLDAQERIRRENTRHHVSAILANNSETARIQARMRTDHQRELHTRQLVLIILSAPLVITALVAVAVEIFK